MIEVAAIDTRNLTFLLNGLKHALIGTGQSGDAAQLVKDQTRLLAIEVGNVIGPQSLAKGVDKIQRDVNSFLFSNKDDNIHGLSRQGEDMTWMYAGPHFLVGASNEDYHGDTWGDASKLLRDAKTAGPRGKTYIEIGERGKQHVMKVNRTVISTVSKNALLQKLYTHIGRMKASILQTAVKLGPTLTPGWILQHMPSPKAISDLTGLDNAESPSTTFGSTSRGISRMRDKVQRAVRIREKKMAIALKGILSGYSKDFKAGHPPRRRHHASA